LPTGIDSPRRVARNGREEAGTGAVTFTVSPLPVEVAFERSAGPVSRPRSDGFDRRRLDLDDDLVGAGLRHVDPGQRQFELAFGGDEGAKLQSR
jgi:hypothetical protein